MLGAIVTVLAVVSGNVFDRIQWPLVGATAAAALAMALVSAVRAWLRVPLSVLVAIGGVVGAVLWHGGDLRDVVPGLESGPRRLLTSEWPSPTDPIIVGTLALLFVVTLLASNEIAQRSGVHIAPLAPPAVAAMLLVALGAPVSTSGALVGLLGVLALVFALVREGDGSPRPTIRFDRTVILSIGLVGAIGIGTSSLIGLAERADPRRPQDAEAVAALLDPIEATTAMRSADPVVELFDIVDRSTLIGRSLPARWRSAALTEYDGQRWLPQVTVRPIGGRLGLASDATLRRLPSIRYSVEYRSDDLRPIPFPGRPLEVDRDVLTDLERVVVIPAGSPENGTRVDAVSEIDPTMAEAQVSNFALRQIDDIAVGFTDRARALAGTTTTQFEQLQALESTMRDSWQLDNNAPGAGQQLVLIERFVVDTQRGSREQFVTAFVLLARALGFDARVATGFVIPAADLRIPLTIRSEHATAWPEVRLAEGGWVAFDPVPEAVSSEEPTPPDPPDAQSPAAVQPPILPPSEEGEEIDDPLLEVAPADSRWTVVGRWALRVGTVVGLAILPFALAISAILLIKWRRRRRRRMLLEPDRRIRAEWANTTDYLIDAGLTVEPSWTDDRIAVAAAPLARRAPFELRRLAQMSTAMTFGDTTRADAMVMDALEASRMVDLAIRTEQTWGQRFRSHLSLRSIRRATRSPVVV